MSSFEWVVGGIGVTVAVALVLVGIVQTLYARKLAKTEIEEIKIDLEKNITKVLDEKALSLYSLIEANVNTMQQRLEDLEQKFQTKLEVTEADFLHYKLRIEGDLARSYALRCQDSDDFGNAVNWWLTAASLYSQIESLDLFPLAVKSTKSNLEKIVVGDSFSIKKLVERLSDNTYQIEQIRKKHPAEAIMLTKILEEKSALPELKSSLTTN